MHALQMLTIPQISLQVSSPTIAHQGVIASSSDNILQGQFLSKYGITVYFVVDICKWPTFVAHYYFALSVVSVQQSDQFLLIQFYFSNYAKTGESCIISRGNYILLSVIWE